MSSKAGTDSANGTIKLSPPAHTSAIYFNIESCFFLGINVNIKVKGKNKNKN